MMRVTLKRLTWLGLTFLAVVLIYVVRQRIVLTSSQIYPLSHITFYKNKLPKNESSILTKNSFREEANDFSDYASAGQTKKPSFELGKVTAAARKFKAVLISPGFKFINHVYFYPPETGREREFSRYLINPLDTCSGSAESKKDSPLLMMLVLSSYRTQASKEREGIRKTYGSVTKGHRWPTGSPVAGLVKMVFLLGRPPTTRDQQLVDTENAEHGDLLVADFLDSYKNLTLKVLHGLHWALQHCPQAKFILKVDDDVFVNLPPLTVFLLNHSSNNSIYGHAYFNGNVVRKGRWAVSMSAYPLPRYPVYMSGTCYVMSMDAAQKIVQASYRLPLIPIEDAFITGILPQITAIRRMSCTGFTYQTESRPHDCEFINNKRLIGNNMHTDEKMGLWLTMSTDHLLKNCVVGTGDR